MIEDFKNVIITFGLIAIVFLQGSYSYERKIQNDIIIAIQQENIQRIKNTAVTATEKDLLQNQLNQQQELINQQSTQDSITTLSDQKSNLPNTNVSNKTQEEIKIEADRIAQQKALLLAKQQAQAALKKAQTLAAKRVQTAALARAKATTPSSRQSRAS
ncbi:MAG TPA: hypothetical protein VIK86_08410 [Candidatus Paceibacterota bacterium]